MADEILRSRTGHIEVLTINRPEARNAINRATAVALSDALDELEDDKDCWVVILTGAEDKAFSAWVEGRTPAGRWAKPEELGGAVVFLASDAAAYVNGHVLAVDGGLSVTM